MQRVPTGRTNRGCRPLQLYAAAMLVTTIALAGPEQPGTTGSHGLVGDMTVGEYRGDYGATSESRIDAVSARLRWLASHGQLVLALPYYRMTRDGAVAVVGGLGGGILGGIPLLPPSGGPSPPSTTPTKETVTGMGDADLRGEVFLLKGSATRPRLSALADVKAPTADATTGLGTGKTDYTGGIGLFQPMGTLGFLADASYSWIGDPSTIDFEDVVTLGAGLLSSLGARATGFAYYQSRTHPLRGAEDQRAILVGCGFRPRSSERLHVSANVLIGLSDTAAKLGCAVTLGGSY